MNKTIGAITMLAAVLVSSVATRFVLNRLKNNAAKTSDTTSQANTIRQPKLYLYVGIGCCLGCVGLALLVLVAPSEDDIAMRIFSFCLFLVAGIACSFIIMFQLNWRIDVGEKSFSYTNIWRKTVTYEFSQISLIDTPSALDIIGHDGKRTLRISRLQENVSCLRDAYKKWEKVNGIKKQRHTRNLIYKYGSYARNISITFLTLGCISCVLATLSSLIGEIDVIIISFILLGFTLPVGIISLLLYKVWKIEITNDKFIFRNFLGITKTYELSKVTEINNAKTTEYFYGKTRIARVWDHLIG